MKEILEEVDMFLNELGKHVRIDEAYLFGSYVKGTWIKTSDIDLIVVSRDFENLKYIDRLELAYRIQWKLGLKHFIEVIPLTPREFNERKKNSVVVREAGRYWLKIR